MNTKKELSFTVNKKDVRKLAANAIDHIINRFRHKLVADIEKISHSISYEKGESVLVDIEKLLENCYILAHEFEDIAPLILQVDDQKSRDKD